MKQPTRCSSRTACPVLCHVSSDLLSWSAVTATVMAMVLPQHGGDVRHNAKRPMQVEGDVVSFAKDRPKLPWDLSLQDLVFFVGYVEGVVSRNGQLAADESDQSPVVCLRPA